MPKSPITLKSLWEFKKSPLNQNVKAFRLMPYSPVGPKTLVARKLNLHLFLQLSQNGRAYQGSTLQGCLREATQLYSELK